MHITFVFVVRPSFLVFDNIVFVMRIPLHNTYVPKAVENWRTSNEDVGATGGNTHMENLVRDNTNVEPYINCTQPDAMEDEVIVGAKIVVKISLAVKIL